MSDSFIIVQNLEFNEYLRATFMVMWRSRLIQRFLLFFLILALSSWLLGTFTQEGPLQGSSLLKEGLLPILALLLVLAGFVAFGCAVIYRTKPQLFRGLKYHFSESGLLKKGEGIEVRKSWSEIRRFSETKSFILLFVSETDAHIIQKRMFSNKEELQDFISFLALHISR